jgi:hypothetical protein
MTEVPAPPHDDDPDRFRLSEEQWLTLCCEFNLETNWLEERNASLSNQAIDREQIAWWHRHELEDACYSYSSPASPSPALQRRALGSFISAADALLESYKAIPSDYELARTLIRDIRIALPSSSFAQYEWDSLPPDYDICADLLKHIEVMRDSAKNVLEFEPSSRSLRKPAQKFLLSGLCHFWENVLFLPVSRASAYDEDSKIERFLIRVPKVVFELNISSDQAAHAIRDFLKDSKKEFDRYGS